MSLPEYTFVPWLRQGLAGQIGEVENFGAATGGKGRATVGVELHLKADPAPGASTPALAPIERDVQLLSPGDVASLKPEAILRSHPLDGVRAATPDQLAYVEFFDEDLPWRYTPAKATASKLRPWLALLVLTPDEYTLEDRGQGALPILTFTSRAQLPPNEETWAWAHVQLSQVVGKAQVAATIAAAPEQARSRLLSPRRLRPGTDYEAFLVPAFEAGRLAGLRRPTNPNVRAQDPSWGLTQHAADRAMPIYHRFRFRTATSGDFETLAMQIKPQTAGPNFGLRDVDVSTPGFGLPGSPGAVGSIEGALAPPTPAGGESFHQAFAPQSTTATQLQPVLDAANESLLPPPAPTATQPEPAKRDPVVVPPTYGLHHTTADRLIDAANEPQLSWLVELNLDLRSRAAAGLGVEVVRQRQEDYMQRAWEQVTRVEEANQRLREAELARAASESLLRKHLEPLAGDDRLAALTGPAHGGLLAAKAITQVTDGDTLDPQTHAPVTIEGSLGAAAASASVRAAIDRSRVPAGAQSPAFRRLVRPERPLVKRLPVALQRGALQRDLLTTMDRPATSPGLLTTAPPPAALQVGVAIPLLQSAVSTAAATIAAQPPRPAVAFITTADGYLQRYRSTNASDDLTALTLTDVRTELTTRLQSQPPPGVDATRLAAIVAAMTAFAGDATGRATITVGDTIFDTEFSDDAAGKTLGTVAVVRATARLDPGATIGRLTTADDVAAFSTAFTDFSVGVLGETLPVPAPPLGASQLGAPLLSALNPAVTIIDRVLAAVPVAKANPPYEPLKTVQAHPEFPDPMLGPLRAISQDLVIPNVADLPPDSMVVMEPNRRFIESYLAGVNVAINQELLWREYPTDQRGTPFRVFWDPLDGAQAGTHTDVKAMHEWLGELGAQRAVGAADMIVLVLRGELLERYPSTVVFAQKARFATNPTTGAVDPSAPRLLDPTAPLKQPVFSSRLDPDIRLVGFPLSVADARGQRPTDPGYFFVFMERPGEPQFGADTDDPPLPLPLTTWDNLAWAHLTGPAGSPFVHVAPNAGLTAPAPGGAQPTSDPRRGAVWGKTSADMASILLQSPMILARHASEMLK